jgi:hypothetical protein
MRHNAVTVPRAVPTLYPPTLASESVTPLARISSIASACLICSSCSVASSLAMSCGRGEDRGKKTVMGGNLAPSQHGRMPATETCLQSFLSLHAPPFSQSLMPHPRKR